MRRTYRVPLRDLSVAAPRELHGRHYMEHAHLEPALPRRLILDPVPVLVYRMFNRVHGGV